MTDLLSNIEEPRRVTHLLYKSNMSYTQLIKYLNVLVDLGLAQENRKPFHAFTVTQNGKTFYKLIKNIKIEDSTQKVTK
jgi:predicted transcriptional regulator